MWPARRERLQRRDRAHRPRTAIGWRDRPALMSMPAWRREMLYAEAKAQVMASRTAAPAPPAFGASPIASDAPVSATPVESLPVDPNAGSQTPGFQPIEKTLGGVGFPPAAG